MADRLTRFVLVGALVVFAFFVARPYVELLLVPATPRPVVPRGSLADFEKTTIAIFQQASPSVVQIVGRVAGERLGPESEAQLQTGTGFIWDGVGHVVTNNHVVEGTSNLIVRMASGKIAETSVAGTAPNYDLAVIRLRDAGRLPPALAVGSSSDLQVGQSAFAIGNPYGLNQSLTTGVVSALRRRLPTSGGREIANVIQTDAAINPGNSGGPLLDSSGRLIGVNTAILSPSGTSAGIGFAIPVDVVNRIVPELIRSGHVPTPGIGIVAASEAVATRLGVNGVVVVRTMPGSPAQQAGLRGIDMANGTIGDVIVAVNGHEVRSLADLTDEFEQIGIGHSAQLTVLRGGSRITVDVNIIDISKTS